MCVYASFLSIANRSQFTDLSMEDILITIYILIDLFLRLI